MNLHTKLHILNFSNEDGSHDIHLSREASHSLHWEKFAKQLMNADDFLAYVAKNGYHFTPSLADCVTKHHIENADGTKHNWTTAQVKAALEAAGMTENPLHMTWGDAAYLANWFYSDEFPDYLKTETDVIKRTYKAAQDPDGYEGMTFSRWLSDVVGHQLSIDWKLYT